MQRNDHSDFYNGRFYPDAIDLPFPFIASTAAFLFFFLSLL
jgi:hypothetical protein